LEYLKRNFNPASKRKGRISKINFNLAFIFIYFSADSISLFNRIYCWNIVLKNVLITNDDGIESAGILALEKSMRKVFKTFLIAPSKERSATSMALTIFDKMKVEKISENHYIVDGYPVDCTNIGLHGKIFPPIDIVISGINRGVNMGHDVHYSGTVGAARHGAIHDKISFAVSSGKSGWGYDYEKEAEFIVKLFTEKLSAFKKGVVYNINLPKEFSGSLNDIKITRLGSRTYMDNYEVTTISENESVYFLGGSDLGFKTTPGSDFEAFHNQFVSLTPISLHPTEHSEVDELVNRLCL
jgi:5'-nucleotidase